MSMDFNKYTEKAQEMLMITQAIMQRFQNTQLDTDHLLLAMLEQPDGTIPSVLESMKVDVVQLANSVKNSLTRMPKVTGGAAGGQMQIYPTPAAQRVLGELAGAEAQKMKDEYIATEHVLLAILAKAARRRRASCASSS